MDRVEQFKAIQAECAELFAKKNAEYGDDFFTGGYSALERYMSIRRKIARLNAHYSPNTKAEMHTETIQDTWKDLANYAIMELMVLKND